LPARLDAAVTVRINPAQVKPRRMLLLIIEFLEIGDAGNSSCIRLPRESTGGYNLASRGG
jgi:hypothetical protein